MKWVCHVYYSTFSPFFQSLDTLLLALTKLGSGRLTETNIVLSSASKNSRVHRIKLDLAEVAASGESLEFFPGQVVAVQGTIPYGNRIIAQKIYRDASKPIRYVPRTRSLCHD